MNYSNRDKPKWTLPQACEIVEVNQSQLHKWLRENILEPAEKAPAKGRPNKFSYNDLTKLAVLKILGKHRFLESKKDRAAGFLVGNTNFSKVGQILSIGPVPESKTAWENKLRNSPVGDEEFVLSINVDIIRRKIDQKIG
jgi:hypothetical protein